MEGSWKLNEAATWGDLESRLPTGPLLTSLNSLNFLSYHEKSRHSSVAEQWLLTFENHDQIYAWLPISSSGDGELIAHGGTTWGGLITANTSIAQLALLYARATTFVREELNTDHLVIRLPPERLVPDSALHGRAIFEGGGTIRNWFLGRMIDSGESTRWNRLRLRTLKGAKSLETHIKWVRASDPELYELIRTNRLARHGVQPAHTLHDLRQIDALTRESWQGFLLMHDDHPCAGALCIPDSNFVVLQYLAASGCALDSGTQDLLLSQLIRIYKPTPDHPLLLGTSTEPTTNHRTMNLGLDRYKASWGSTPYSYYSYELSSDSLATSA